MHERAPKKEIPETDEVMCSDDDEDSQQEADDKPASNDSETKKAEESHQKDGSVVQDGVKPTAQTSNGSAAAAGENHEAPQKRESSGVNDVQMA